MLVYFLPNPYNKNYWYPMEHSNYLMNKDNEGWGFGDLIITDSALKNIHLKVVDRFSNSVRWVWLNGELSKNGNVYSGQLHTDFSNPYITMRPVPNPFYFDQYQPEINPL